MERKYTYKTNGARYTLTMKDASGFGRPTVSYTLKRGRDVIFSGSDFHPSHLHDTLGRESADALMTFLTLKPGDTDAEYFNDYTPEQMDFATSTNAEYIGYEIMAREERNASRQR